MRYFCRSKYFKRKWLFVTRIYFSNLKEGFSRCILLHKNSVETQFHTQKRHISVFGNDEEMLRIANG